MVKVDHIIVFIFLEVENLCSLHVLHVYAIVFDILVSKMPAAPCFMRLTSSFY